MRNKTEIRNDPSVPTNPPQLLLTSSDVLQLLNRLDSSTQGYSSSPPRLPQKTLDEMAKEFIHFFMSLPKDERSDLVLVSLFPRLFLLHVPPPLRSFFERVFITRPAVQKNMESIINIA